MGERLRKRGKKRAWEARIKVGDAWAWKSTGALDKTAARSILTDWERRAADPTYRAETEATLKDVLRRYLQSRVNKQCAPETIRYYQGKFGPLLRLLPPMLEQLNQDVVQGYIASRIEEKTTPQSIAKELAEWRSGKRHILRRVYWGDKYVSHIDFTRRKNAHGYARMLREDYGVSAKITRVTVGPAKPKEAK